MQTGNDALESRSVLPVMTLAAFALVAALALLSLYGWGGVACRLLKCSQSLRATQVAIGLAAVVFIGGVLNLLRIGHGPVLDILTLVGLFAAPMFRNRAVQPGAEKRGRLYLSLLAVVVLTAIGATVATQLPPSAFNYHDDFHKYFTHPVRMLQTGTLFGSPLSALGSETLGGQAVLHAFVLNHFPVQYIYGVDSVFGLMLCLVMAVSLIPARTVFLPLALMLMAIVLAVNPLTINVSSIYIGCALLMAAIQVYHLMPVGAHRGSNRRHAFVIGLLYAALIAVKTSFAGYVMLQVVIFTVLACLYAAGRRERLAFSGWVVASTLSFLAPWILLYLPHYAGGAAGRILPLADGTWGEPYQQYVSLFSFEPSYYGPGYGHYTLLAATAALLGLACLLFRGVPGPGKPPFLPEVASCGLAAGTFYVALVLLGPDLNGYDVSLRLTVSVLIAAVPVIASVVSLQLYESGGAWSRGNKYAAMLVVLGMLLTAGFARDAVMRFKQGMESGNVLAFPELASSEPYLAYSRDVLYGSARERIRRVQQLVPPGIPFFAWISTPFLLDFSRNRICDADQAGIGSPWSYLPDVEYYVYEYEGYAVQPMSSHLEDLRFPGAHERFVTRKVLSLLGRLERLKDMAEVLYDDGGILVFRIPARSSQGR